MKSESDEAVARLMHVFARFTRADWRKLTKWGIRASEVRLLLTIVEIQEQQAKVGTTVSELSRVLKVTSPTITQIANSLIKTGYLQRTVHPEDKRISTLRLTDEGEKVAEAARTEFRALFAGLIAQLGKEDSNRLINLLGRAFDYFASAQASQASSKPEEREHDE